ncbi:uncharacterized protein LOC129604603 [Betta splendens]|uniref:Uncharacterized protein LOC129604603 n=1 Tax=Betta splendens TaxID=158456 RepID=A0A9W2Y1D8_BETSP|nr:uncharacterized protein LOC129604603 [Betta splendens]
MRTTRAEDAAKAVRRQQLQERGDSSNKAVWKQLCWIQPQESTGSQALESRPPQGADADMTEPHTSLLYLPIIYLWTGGVDGDMLASLAPPVHLSGERLGWTLLVCMVSDIGRGRLQVSWRSPSEGRAPTTQHSLAINKKHRSHRAVAIITVATRDWPSFSCSVSHRRHAKPTRRRFTSSPDGQDNMCREDEDEHDVLMWTNTVVVQALRLILMKIIVFNTLMTIYAVIT